MLQYLRSGEVFAVAPGISRDVLDGSIIGAPSQLTDGVWSWSGDLAHHVERYHLELPKAFVEHMRLKGWIASTVP